MNRLTLFAIFSVALFSACGSSSLSSKAENATASSTSDAPAVDDKSKSANTSASSANTAKQSFRRPTKTGNALAGQVTSLNQARQSQDAPLTFDRKVIRNAEVNLETDSPEDAQRTIGSIAERKGGFVVESQQSSTDDRSTTRDTVVMSVRVPSERFAETLDEIRSTAKRIIAENIKGEDVTEEFIDVEARLKAKKALEQQFTEIMKRANSVEDALNVQAELADVRAEIEKIEGRKRYLENQASMSTIRVKLQTPTAFAASSDGFSDRLAESFGIGLDFALNFVLGLVTLGIGILPFALFIGLPGYLIARAVMRRRNRPMSVSEIAKEEIKNE